MIETRALVVAAHQLAGTSVPAAPKDGARFHFSFPGSLQGFACENDAPAKLHPLTVENVGGRLALGFRRLAPGRVARVSTPTFFGKDELTMPTYRMVACPTLYSGQTVECSLAADVPGGTVSVRLYASVFDANDALVKIHGEPRVVGTASDVTLKWRLPDTRGYPIFDIGLEIKSQDVRGADGTLYLDRLHWDGAPDIVLRRPDPASEMWKHAFMNDVSQFQTRWEGLRVTSNTGLGMLAQGTRDWRDYEVAATVTPLLAEAWGLAARVQGRERYYALMFDRTDERPRPADPPRPRRDGAGRAELPVVARPGLRVAPARRRQHDPRLDRRACGVRGAGRSAERRRDRPDGRSPARSRPRKSG